MLLELGVETYSVIRPIPTAYIKVKKSDYSSRFKTLHHGYLNYFHAVDIDFSSINSVKVGQVLVRTKLQ